MIVKRENVRHEEKNNSLLQINAPINLTDTSKGVRFLFHGSGSG